MNTISKGRIIIVVTTIIFLVVALTSCSVINNLRTDNNIPEPQQTEDEAEPETEGASPVEPAVGSDTLPCPAKGTSMVLGFDHALTMNYESTSMTHFLHQGWLRLIVTDDNGKIVSEGSPSLTTSVEGRMSDECSLTGEGTMKPSVHGTCKAGVVSLFIEENWLPMDGEMVCIDEDGDVDIIPFDVPAMGLQQHSGASGNGEIFYLVEDSEGYSTMRPFQQGSGYHTWTLYAEDIPIVPLVP